ncbi:ABC transporter permease subunit [Microbacterium panaciterrae]|uniref:ABC transporter permease n=1 Tax=Microbacterium panaciterrae TaxID=985759 RepID=A0ABP8P201_9MICO
MSATTATLASGAGFSEKLRTLATRRAGWVPVLAAVVIFAAMLVAGQLYFGTFVSPRLLSSLLLDNAYLLILAVGMTFVILTGGIDLSVGSVMAFTGILGARMLRDGMSAGVVIPVMLVAGAILGLFTGVLVQYFDVQPFIASLATMFLARGLAFVVSLEAIQVKDPLFDALQSSRFRLDGGWYITPTVILSLIAVAVAAWVLGWTRFGRTVYAVGGSEQSARLMGLPVARVKLLVYVISGLCAGIAGVVFTAYTGAGYSLNGIGAELDTIAAVVIGGTLLTGGSGYVLGSLFGVLVYGLIKVSISFLGADTSWMRITIGALLLVFVVVQRLIVTRARRR